MLKDFVKIVNTVYYILFRLEVVNFILIIEILHHNLRFNIIFLLTKENIFFTIICVMHSMNIFRQTAVIRLSVKQCPIHSTKYKSTKSKNEDLKEKIKMKTPIGNVK